MEEQIQFAATGVFCNLDITSSICVWWRRREKLVEAPSAVLQPRRLLTSDGGSFLQSPTSFS